MADKQNEAKTDFELPVIPGEAELLSTIFEDVMKHVIQTADLDE
ncbi:MAG: hypothetical protein RIF37_15295 [Rhodospirillaceae bacterium]